MVPEKLSREYENGFFHLIKPDPVLSAQNSQESLFPGRYGQ
jgi:hypothetical protein